MACFTPVISVLGDRPLHSVRVRKSAALSISGTFCGPCAAMVTPILQVRKQVRCLPQVTSSLAELGLDPGPSAHSDTPPGRWKGLLDF